MILVDTGALYALADRQDAHHRDAEAYFRGAHEREVLAVPASVVVEAALFLEARLGTHAARALWDDIGGEVFYLLPITHNTLVTARRIDRKYADANLGLVDCTCLALCEEHHIGTVFTYDRRHFGLYRPTFADSLKLVP